MKKGLLKTSLILSLIVGIVCGGIFGVYSYAILPWLPLMAAVAGGAFGTLYLLAVAAGCGIAIFVLSIITLAKLSKDETAFRSKGVAVANLIVELLFVACIVTILLVAQAAITSSAVIFYISSGAMGFVAILTLFGIIRANKMPKISPEVEKTEEIK